LPRSTRPKQPKQTQLPSPRQSRLTNPSPNQTPPLRLAITGGIGAGKSEALETFRRHGAAVLSSDAVVHRLYTDDAEVRAALEERFGTTDRARIGDVVFSDPAELAWLEALLHPRVRSAYAAWLAGVDAPVAVVEIPLLYETGAEGLFDAVVVITATAAIRRKRRGTSVDERSPRLMPDEEKVRRADFAYVNDGPLAELDTFVQAVLERLQEEPLPR
jgi:dephospho-CoA kinase